MQTRVILLRVLVLYIPAYTHKHFCACVSVENIRREKRTFFTVMRGNGTTVETNEMF